MCGIAAVFFHEAKNQTLSQKVLDQMLSKIRHRGHYGLQTSPLFGNSAMGCVRLPIRNPIAGAQPSYNKDLTVAALLNGEIYNVEALTGNANDSDTGMLPNLYRSSHSKPADLQGVLKCRGMYALVIHDIGDATHRAYILRDHIGIKPLYLVSCPFGIAVASEKKAFTTACFDVEAYNRAREVMPGELLTLEHIDSTWAITGTRSVLELLRPTPISGTSGGAEALRELIADSVTRQWPVEDLPMAVLCSGGIDSSIVTYELRQTRKRLGTDRQALVAYAVSCVDAAGNITGSDVVAARQLCGALGIELREVYISYDDLFNVLGDVIYHLESFEPNLVRNAAIQYHLMQKIAADGFRIVFCGEGADECFWGYADFAAAEKPRELSEALLADLYRTQLQRVDRMGMAHTLEVRVPLLDEDIVTFSATVPDDRKELTACGLWLGKGILREAYVDRIPDEVVLRRKATFAFGAGFGGVEMDDDPMNSRSEHLLKARGQSCESIAQKFPEAFFDQKATAERALYVDLYHELGYSMPGHYLSPVVARKEQAKVGNIDE